WRESRAVHAPVEAPSGDEPPPRSHALASRFLKRAAWSRKLGNQVRSAILATRAERLLGPSRAGQARSQATADIEGLAGRLARLPEFADQDARSLIGPL